MFLMNYDNKTPTYLIDHLKIHKKKKEKNTTLKIPLAKAKDRNPKDAQQCRFNLFL